MWFTWKSYCQQASKKQKGEVSKWARAGSEEEPQAEMALSMIAVTLDNSTQPRFSSLSFKFSTFKDVLEWRGLPNTSFFKSNPLKASDQVNATVVSDAGFKCRNETDAKQNGSDQVMWKIFKSTQVLLWTSRDISQAKARLRQWLCKQETGPKSFISESPIGRNEPSAHSTTTKELILHVRQAKIWEVEVE